jgi:hypothetical protein
MQKFKQNESVAHQKHCSWVCATNKKIVATTNAKCMDVQEEAKK